MRGVWLRRCVSASSKEGAVLASRSARRYAWELSGSLAVSRGCSPLGAAGKRRGSSWTCRLPLPFSQTPPESLGNPSTEQGRAVEAPPFFQLSLRAVKLTKWAQKARFWETCEGNGRDLRVKVKL